MQANSHPHACKPVRVHTVHHVPTQLTVPTPPALCSLPVLAQYGAKEGFLLPHVS